MCKNSFGHAALVLAALLAAALLSCGCGKKPNNGFAGDIIEIGRQTEQAEPSAGNTESTAVTDPSVFDNALSNLCSLAAEPGFQKVRALMPADYFNNLSAELNRALEEAGMTLSGMGYDSFDAFMEASMGELDLGNIMDAADIDHVESVGYKVLGYEPADVDAVRASLSETMDGYIDVSNVTEAYKVGAEFTVRGDGAEKTNNAELTLYRYGDEFFIVFE